MQKAGVLSGGSSSPEVLVQHGVLCKWGGKIRNFHLFFFHLFVSLLLKICNSNAQPAQSPVVACNGNSTILTFQKNKNETFKYFLLSSFYATHFDSYFIILCRHFIWTEQRKIIIFCSITTRIDLPQE